MPSKYYQESLNNNINFQKNNKSWAGKSVGGYASSIRELVQKYNAQTLLDYGCGKGLQYSRPTVYEGTGVEQTFDQYLGISNVYKYDPCVDYYSQLPEPTQKFDAVILTQVLPYIPDDDISWVKTLLMSHTNKFCFIGNYDPTRVVKGPKQELMNPKYFKVARTMDWYYEQFADWTGSALYWNFKVGDGTAARVFRQTH